MSVCVCVCVCVFVRERSVCKMSDDLCHILQPLNCSPWQKICKIFGAKHFFLSRNSNTNRLCQQLNCLMREIKVSLKLESLKVIWNSMFFLFEYTFGAIQTIRNTFLADFWPPLTPCVIWWYWRVPSSMTWRYIFQI